MMSLEKANEVSMFCKRSICNKAKLRRAGTPLHQTSMHINFRTSLGAPPAFWKSILRYEKQNYQKPLVTFQKAFLWPVAAIKMLTLTFVLHENLKIVYKK